jgi:3-keto-disaccharide hydrolase
MRAICLFIVCGATTVAAAGGKDWAPLFNGKNLDGWDTWLGRPNGEKEVVGLNKDPKKVYTVVQVDGKPAVRISGEIFGAITTKHEYENYHLKLEFKWGEKKWPPRLKEVRDSGLLYHCVGPHGAAGSYWMRSQELQIQEKDCGDYWSVAGGIVDVEGERKDGKGPVIYKKGGTKYTVPSKESGGPRIVKHPDNEKPSGEWNTIELVTVGQTSVHIVNGKVVMILTASRHKMDGMEVPLTKGKIQIQSEGAEVFYRNIAIRPITAIPDEYSK